MTPESLPRKEAKKYETKRWKTKYQKSHLKTNRKVLNKTTNWKKEKFYLIIWSFDVFFIIIGDVSAT